ncbi:MAG TPA: FHA domain-containing protein [Myxococcales bacterium]|jgi:pSer/pThr/pTyr-binding forkhead associated (FHA) protein|nr:FHA domain-containing protein [Myxococcales bacterium]
MKLILEDDEGRRTVIPLFRDELTIGRADENTVRLSAKDVSRKHARLTWRNGQIHLEDLNSLTGVRVNGQRIHGRRPIHDGDLIEISRYDLIVESSPGDDKIAADQRQQASAISGTDRDVGMRRAARRAMIVIVLLLAATIASVLWLRALRGVP